MDLRKKFFIGSLGALSPILANILVVDLAVVLADAKPLTIISYLIRVSALCAAACIVVYLNGDEDKPIKVFQLGVVAPALLTGIINGVALSHNVQQRAALEVPAIFGSAFAQPSASSPPASQPQIEDCVKKQDSTAGQEILKGLFSILPENRWYVSTSSNLKLQSAVEEVQEIRHRFPGKFHPKICAPISSDDKYYRVIIGEKLTRDEASKLRDEALAAGLSKSTWLWSPLYGK